MRRLPRPSRSTAAVAVVTAVVASAGTATAAGVLITSSRQIKAGVIKTSDLSASARRALQGSAGPAGAQGGAGAQGTAGAAGARGATGPAGPAGTKGATGAPGAKGDTGAPGAKGDTGTPGAKGDTGTPGAKGDSGAAGARGPSDVLVKRLAPIATVSQTQDASALFTGFELPGTFEAAPSPVLFEVTGSFASGSARSVTCDAVRDGAPVQHVSGSTTINAAQAFAVPAGSVMRAFHYVAVVDASAGQSLGFGCIADGAGVSAPESQVIVTGAEHGYHLS